MRRPVKIVRLRYVQRMRARSDVCELFTKNVSQFAENVSLNRAMFVGPGDYVCEPLQVSAMITLSLPVSI